MSKIKLCVLAHPWVTSWSDPLSGTGCVGKRDPGSAVRVLFPGLSLGYKKVGLTTMHNATCFHNQDRVTREGEKRQERGLGLVLYLKLDTDYTHVFTLRKCMEIFFSTCNLHFNRNFYKGIF